MSRDTLSRMHYVPSYDRTEYFVELPPGWDGKPKVEVPEGFWRGLGYQPELRPRR